MHGRDYPRIPRRQDVVYVRKRDRWWPNLVQSKFALNVFKFVIWAKKVGGLHTALMNKLNQEMKKQTTNITIFGGILIPSKWKCIYLVELRQFISSLSLHSVAFISQINHLVALYNHIHLKFVMFNKSYSENSVLARHKHTSV